MLVDDSQPRSDPRRKADRIQVCVWPTPGGACRKTVGQIEREGYDVSRGTLVTLQEHLRDVHLFQGSYNEFEDYAQFVALLRGYSTSLSTAWHSGGDPFFAAYTYQLVNGQTWLFAGTREQSERWIIEHQAELHGEGNRRLPVQPAVVGLQPGPTPLFDADRASALYVEPTVPITLID